MVNGWRLLNRRLRLCWWCRGDIPSERGRSRYCRETHRRQYLKYTPKVGRIDAENGEVIVERQSRLGAPT